MDLLTPDSIVEDQNLSTGNEVLLFPATRIKMGSRYKYTMPVQLRRLASLLPTINPGDPFIENRKVDPEHGKAFGDYVAENIDTWIEPGILLVAKQDLEFTRSYGMKLPPATGAEETPILEVGYLKLNATEAKYDLAISDGQHRTYGIQSKVVSLLKDKRSAISNEPDSENTDREQEGSTLAQIAEELLTRFNMETMNLTIVSKVPDELKKRWFVTIAKKVWQVKRAEAIRLDSQTNTAVCTKETIAQHKLLDGFIAVNTSKPAERVLSRDNSAAAGSAAIFALPNIEDVVKNIAYSFSKRETKQKTSPVLQETIIKNTLCFFDALVSEVSRFQKLIDDVDYTGKEFRKESLYSSPPFIRVLADVFHQLALKETAVISDGDAIKAYEVSEHGLGVFKALLRNLNPYTDYVEVPGEKGKKSKLQVQDVWYGTLLFRPGSKGPGSAFQELSGLSKLLSHWAKTGEMFVPKTVSEVDALSKGGI
jgi:hypothetical protein